MCSERAQGRQVDPTTNAVYHPKSNPAPEDAKLKERLQDVSDEAGNASRISGNHASYDRRLAALQKWSQQFGLVKDGVCEVPLDLPVAAAGDKSQAAEAVLETLQGVLDFKQAEFDLERLEAQHRVDHPVEDPVVEAEEGEPEEPAQLTEAASI